MVELFHQSKKRCGPLVWHHFKRDGRVRIKGPLEFGKFLKKHNGHKWQTVVLTYSHKPKVCEELHVFVQMLSESFRPAKPVQLVKVTKNYSTLIRVLLKSLIFRPACGLRVVFDGKIYLKITLKQQKRSCFFGKAFRFF